VFLAEHIAGLAAQDRARVLDIGCATGELVGYLSHRFRESRFTGIDVFEPLLAEARKFVPAAEFEAMSALDLPGKFAETFDIVSAVGVLDIFDHDEARKFVQAMMACCRPGGRVYILSPFNEYGMDLNSRHRKWSATGASEWERGNSIYSHEAIRDFAKSAANVSFAPFDIGMSMARREDPQRTWTVEALGKQHQLMNGLKLLMDLQLCTIECA
jgi:cyclopropane fatty-acyl-phospholipid synthase-like methyltransferase